MSVFSNLLQDSLNHRRVSLVGCKMKIYQERMRMTSFLNVVSAYKTDNDWVHLERIDHYLNNCKVVS